MSLREQKVLETLQNLPNVDAQVYQALESDGRYSRSWNVEPKSYIGVRPKN